MSVLSEVDVETRRDLLALERAEIQTHIGSPLCLNHNRPLITPDEKKERDVAYGKVRRSHKSQDERQRVADWRQKNPEKRAEQVRRSLEQQRQKRLHQKNVAE